MTLFDQPTFVLEGVLYAVGDIVEKHDGTWRYWSTIQSLEDAEMYHKLCTTTASYRVVRGVKKTPVMYRL